MTDIFYKNKSIPSIKPGQLQRHRIDALLSKAIEYPVVTVIAGAGYGKTQAVSKSGTGNNGKIGRAHV